MMTSHPSERPLFLRRPGELSDWFLIIIGIAAIIISTAIILAGPGSVAPWPMDQAFASSADLHIGRTNGHWVFHYPYLQHSGGIAASIIAGIYKLLIPTTAASLNWHIKTLGMVGFLTSSLLLLTTFIQNRKLRILIFIIIASSGYQFVEPTSELFASSLFNLFLVGAYRNWNSIISSGLLAGFGLCKVELLLAAIVIAIYWYYWARSNRNLAAWTAISFSWWLLIFMLPGLVVHGSELIIGNRSMNAFEATYSGLFSPHQFSTGLQEGNAQNVPVVSTLFGGASSVLEIALHHPRLYIDFLALSAVQSMINVGVTLNALAIPAIALLWNRRWPPRLRFPLIVLALALVSSLLPAWLFTFVRVRYLSRYFPAIVVVIAAGCLGSTTSPTNMKRLLWISGIVTVISQLLLTMPQMIAYPHFH